MNDLCDAIQDRLVKLHLTGIPITDDPDVNAHLANCSTCRIYHDFLDHDHRALEVYARSLDTYVDQVKQRLHRQIEHTKPGPPNRIPFRWWVLAASIPLVAGMLFLLHSDPTASLDRPRPDRAAHTAQSPTVEVPSDVDRTVDQTEQLAQDTGGIIPESKPTSMATTLAAGQETGPDANGGQTGIVTSDEANQPFSVAKRSISSEPESINEAAAGSIGDLVGTVVTVQGDPVPSIQVFLCQGDMDLSVDNGIPGSTASATRTDAQGRFSIESGRPVKYLVAVGEKGIAQVEYADFQTRRVITLEPWVTVKGDLMIDAHPAIGYMLEAFTRDALESRGAYDAYSRCSTDAEGRFEFDRIPPGHMILYGRDYDVHAGRAYELHLGVGGQSVVGRFVLPEYANRSGILRGEPIVSHVISLDTGEYPMAMSAETEASKSQVFQQISSNEVGQFQADHLESGHYALVGASLDNGSPDRQRHAYRVWHEFAVPAPSQETQGDLPIDIGDVELMLGDLMVGDDAPDFNLWDLEGNPQSLSLSADKLLLLSFYRTDDLNRPSQALQELNDIQNQFAAMESFILIGMLASDESPAKDLEHVNAAGFTWPHVTVGRNELNRTHIEYDVLDTPRPWNILISPDGTILAMGLQGEALIEAIVTRLP